ncbi:MAG TPA: hypothetical protein P5250_05625 [Bacteroidales bacterium]|nr:hypothetical protein [Bacteroidales bacterium]
MKKQIFTIVLVATTFFNVIAQNGVAINTTGAAPDPSAMFDVSSNNKGFLAPRMSEAERIAIVNPARGLLVYQIDNDSGFWFYDGASWVKANAGDNLGNHTATSDLDMDNNKIVNVATCTNNLDAANKEYVDNAVAAGGGGGAKPSMLSSESANPYVYPDAVQYCENLNENGYTDWRLPEADELQYFVGTSGATSNFLWTKTLSVPQDFATNQNFITVRLTDGKWRNGGVKRFYFPSRQVSGSTTATSWTTVATFNPLTTGNLFVISSMVYYGTSYNSGNGADFRLKYNFPDGTYYYSDVYSLYYSYSTFISLTSIPILNEMAAYSSIEVQIQSTAGSNSKSSSLSISGYEISLSQKDGTPLYVRCVR